MKTLRTALLAAITFLSFSARAQLPEHEVLFDFTRKPTGLSELVQGGDGNFYAAATGGPHVVWRRQFLWHDVQRRRR